MPACLLAARPPRSQPARSDTIPGKRGWRVAGRPRRAF